MIINDFNHGMVVMALATFLSFFVGRMTNQPTKPSPQTFQSIAPVISGLADEPIHMPDPDLTPGKVRPDITVKDLATYIKSPRRVTQAMKQKVFETYGISHPRPGEFEIDHLVPRELGGADDIQNLWPQSYHGPMNAHDKDRLENYLHQQVVAGKLDFKEAQESMADNWVAGFHKYLSPMTVQYMPFDSESVPMPPAP